MTLLEYIKMHKPVTSTVDGAITNCCWDCPDKVFDAVITVDCSVEQDGKIDILEPDTEFPNMPLFINEFLGKVTVIALMSDGTPIVDAYGLFKRNIATIKQWVKKNWAGNWTDDDDIIYQLIQEIHHGIAGYKGNKGYGLYLELLRSCDVGRGDMTDKGDLTDQIADIKANCDLAIEGRDVKIMELTERLEDLQEQNSEMFNTIALQEQQVEKMKCCKICAYGGNDFGVCYSDKPCKNKNRWKLAKWVKGR